MINSEKNNAGPTCFATIHVLILVPVFFALMKERALRRGTLRLQVEEATKDC